MSTLLEIGEDYRALFDLLQESGGEVTPDSEAAIEGFYAEIQQNQEHKLYGYAAIVREFELRRAAHQEELERQAKHVKACDNAIRRLKDRAKQFLEMTGQKKVHAGPRTFTVCANGGKQPLRTPDDAEQLPPRYRRAVWKPDDEAIREDLVAGRAVSGCELLPRGTHLRIT